MSLTEKILNKILSRKQLAFKRDGILIPYLTRWHIIRQNKLFGTSLHRIDSSDVDLQPHNHPRFFISIVLKGRYTEENWKWDQSINTLIGPTYKERGCFSIALRPHTHIHRVLNVNKSVWTLIFWGPKRNNGIWGFFTENKFIPEDEYMTIHPESKRIVIRT